MKHKGAGKINKAIHAALLLGIFILLPGTGMAKVKKPPKEKAITVVKENGVWWLKDTEGKKFFSLGVCCIDGCFGHAEEKPLTPELEKETIGRLRKWGFNTAAAWSSPTTWKSLYVVDQIYPVYKHEDSDIFAPGFGSTVFESHLADEIASFTPKKNLIGYCLHNEVEWPVRMMFDIYLSRSPESPGSQELVSFTRSYYGNDIKALNNAWETRYQDFTDIAGKKAPKSYPNDMWAFMVKWRTHTAETFYRRYSAMVRALDPGRLILGVRYKGWMDRDVHEAIAKYFDVITINRYNRYADFEDFCAYLNETSGKPVMITEYSFSGFPEPGKSSGLSCEVYSQENRAIGYRKFVRNHARVPFMVGMHWFMWNDYVTSESATPWAEPDQNVGLVSQDFKKPYKVLVDEAARTNRQVKEIHANSRKWKKKGEAPLVTRDIPYFVPTLDGDLGEWPANTMLKPRVVRSLQDKPQLSHTYYLSHDHKYLYLAASFTDDHLDIGSEGDAWNADHFQLWLPVEKSLEADDGINYLVFPTGSGTKMDEPYASAFDKGYAPGEGWKVVRKGGSGQYTLEARFPLALLNDKEPGKIHSYKVSYTNMSGIYETEWRGRGILAPAATLKESPK